MTGSDVLRQMLARFDGKGYKAYKQIAGEYAFDGFVLAVDHVQGDPFAAPSKVRCRVPMDRAGIPGELRDTRVRRVAAEDFFARAVRRAIRAAGTRRRGTGHSGLVEIDAGAQEVLERTAVVLTDAWIEARIHVGLPAAGRSVLGRAAEQLLCEDIPAVVDAALLWETADRDAARRFVGTVENYHAVRDALAGRGLVAFVADGAVLPRESGASDRPLPREAAVAFRACDPYHLSFPLPNGADGTPGAGAVVTGFGIPAGVTLVVGGGYHGKSTLLRALERGVYPHVPGDGRELVVTDPDAVKIRAEDGRRVERVDIRPFIGDLPFGRDTGAFTSDDASGSTSQAANIVEAVEAGARVLLLDEDTSATNFMVRDARMQALVAKEHEPITPFLDRVRELYDAHGVSTVLVMGGSGDYFDVADHVVMMREYLPHDATGEARRVAGELPTRRRREAAPGAALGGGRVPDPRSLDPSRGRRDVRVDADGVRAVRFGRATIDLAAVEQIVDRSQTRALGLTLALARARWMGEGLPLAALLDRVEAFFDEEGLDALDLVHRPGHHPGDLARPRRHEIAAALNRLRTLRVRRS